MTWQANAYRFRWLIIPCKWKSARIQKRFMKNLSYVQFNAPSVYVWSAKLYGCIHKRSKYHVLEFINFYWIIFNIDCAICRSSYFNRFDFNEDALFVLKVFKTHQLWTQRFCLWMLAYYKFIVWLFHLASSIERKSCAGYPWFMWKNS